MNNPTVDPTTIATVWHSMQSICREMRDVMSRTAQKFLIAQLHDSMKKHPDWIILWLLELRLLEERQVARLVRSGFGGSVSSVACRASVVAGTFGRASQDGYCVFANHRL